MKKLSVRAKNLFNRKLKACFLISKGKNYSVFSQIFFVLGFFSFGLALLAILIFPSSPLKKQVMANDEIRVCLGFDHTRRAKCLNQLLRKIVPEEGIKPALQIIEPIVARHSFMLEWTHTFAHTIGNFGLLFYQKQGGTLYESIGKALIECNGFGAFGCYHGVIEAGIGKLPVTERTKVIRAACMENPLIQRTQYYVNQCLHWFGHGNAVFANISLDKTLAMCEGLSNTFNSDEVQLCLSGVFHAGTQPGGADDSLLHNIKNVWSADDVYYPCRDIPERFRGHCYSHAAGRSRSNDFSVTFGVCNNIPEHNFSKKRDYVQRCYDSAANPLLLATVKATALSETEKIIKIVDSCKKYASPEFRRYCYGGAVRYWVLFEPSIENVRPFEICRLAEEDAKSVCYGSIGFGNNENYYDKNLRAKYCNNAEKKFFEDCLFMRVK